MKLTCMRCNHRWETRTHSTPSVCPKCKSTVWDKPLNSSEVSELLNERCRGIIAASTNVDYCTMAPTLLLTVMVAFAEAEKAAAAGGGSFANAKPALGHLDIIKQLVVAKVIPEELYGICWRLSESYIRDAGTPTKNTNPTENEYKQKIVNNWNVSILSDLTLAGVEVVLPDLDCIDILAKDSDGRDVIVELKKGAKDGYRQLRAYGFFYENPRLINVSEEPVKSPKQGIEYRIF